MTAKTDKKRHKNAICYLSLPYMAGNLQKQAGSLVKPGRKGYNYLDEITSFGKSTERWRRKAMNLRRGDPR